MVNVIQNRAISSQNIGILTIRVIFSKKDSKDGSIFHLFDFLYQTKIEIQVHVSKFDYTEQSFVGITYKWHYFL